MPYLIVLGIICIIALLCLVRGIYETFVLKVSVLTLGKGKRNLKVVFFSDLHAQYMRIPTKKIVSVIKSNKPDVVLFGGDITNDGRTSEKIKATKIFEEISAELKRIGIPFFGVYGNHDSHGLIEEFANNSNTEYFKVLRNESTILNSKDNSNWVLTGLDDLRIGNPDYINSRNYLTSPEMDLPEIILAHNPDTVFTLPKTVYSNYKSKFMLSGHFHGGQIWMPFNLEYKVLRNEVMADMGNRKGIFRLHGLMGYITRGIGCVIVPLRFFSYPEIVVINFFA